MICINRMEVRKAILQMPDRDQSVLGSCAEPSRRKNLRRGAE